MMIVDRLLFGNSVYGSNASVYQRKMQITPSALLLDGSILIRFLLTEKRFSLSKYMKMTDFLEKKLKTYFQYFSEDGVATFDTYKKFFNSDVVKESLKGKMDDPVGTLKANWEKWLVADKDKDGKVEFKEFFENFLNTKDSDEKKQQAIGKLTLLFSIIDKDNDGTIGIEEFTKWLNKLKVTT
ncbi:hypothetical protein SNEBB_011194 [Seison nebaliae]|nr:hypothetical protein SNEBB_011194 [Seison nebaliae]